jgi:hypothetical protein
VERGSFHEFRATLGTLEDLAAVFKQDVDSPAILIGGDGLFHAFGLNSS